MASSAVKPLSGILGRFDPATFTPSAGFEASFLFATPQPNTSEANNVARLDCPRAHPSAIRQSLNRMTSSLVILAASSCLRKPSASVPCCGSSHRCFATASADASRHHASTSPISETRPLKRRRRPPLLALRPIELRREPFRDRVRPIVAFCVALANLNPWRSAFAISA